MAKQLLENQPDYFPGNACIANCQFTCPSFNGKEAAKLFLGGI